MKYIITQEQLEAVKQYVALSRSDLTVQQISSVVTLLNSLEEMSETTEDVADKKTKREK